MRRTMSSLRKPKAIRQTCIYVQPLHQKKKKKKKKEGKIRNGALPLGMAVCPGLCWSSVTLSSTARKGEGGDGGGREKWLTVKNKSDTLKFPSFLLFTIEIFFFFPVWKLWDFRGDFSSFRQLNLWFGIRTSLSYV